MEFCKTKAKIQESKMSSRILIQARAKAEIIDAFYGMKNRLSDWEKILWMRSGLHYSLFSLIRNCIRLHGTNTAKFLLHGFRM